MIFAISLVVIIVVGSLFGTVLVAEMWRRITASPQREM